MSSIEDLLNIMARLRDPENGCPWDLEQNFDSIAPSTIEEAYEVADAIAEADYQGLREELGDLLLQVVFHSQMASEQRIFDFSDVITAICEKLIKRHPHVFGRSRITNAEEQSLKWEQQKEAERRERKIAAGNLPSVLDEVALALPSLLRAYKLQKRSASVGFDWPDLTDVLDKLDEEIEELEEIIEHDSTNHKALLDEMGDILFTCANLSRRLGLDPEEALRHANYKFEKRFRTIEKHLSSEGRQIADTPLEELDELWERAKVAVSGK